MRQPVDESDVVLVGSPDPDPPEVAYLEQGRIRHCEVADLPTITLPDRPLYVGPMPAFSTPATLPACP